MRALVVLLIVLLTHDGAVADESTTARHLLTGVRAFKDGHYEEALVELRIVARAADAPPDLAFYLGPTLYKLGRYREAIAIFVTSPASRDALSDFYLGQAYYQAKLYRKARDVFTALRTRGLGPALDAAAARYVDAVDVAYKSSPDLRAIDVYIAQAAEITASDPVIAAEILDEARLVEQLAAKRHRNAEILAALAAAWNAAKRPQAVIDVLAQNAPTVEARWQLARAYVAVGDGGRARPLLQAIIDDKKATRATDAAALLATLQP